VATRAEVLEILHLLDKPDAAWEDPAMSDIYDDLRAEFDLSDRYSALESKLRSVQESLELVLDVVRDRRLVLLEATIVLLILFEIVLTLTRARLPRLPRARQSGLRVGTRWTSEWPTIRGNASRGRPRSTRGFDAMRSRPRFRTHLSRRSRRGLFPPVGDRHLRRWRGNAPGGKGNFFSMLWDTVSRHQTERTDDSKSLREIARGQ
jgi:hypothetical protein